MKEPSLQPKEAQYRVLIEREAELGRARFGLMSSQVYHDDPKRLGFLLARYKFVAKMLAGLGRVAEIGCADAFGTPVVAKEVGSILATDFDPLFIRDAKERLGHLSNLSFLVHDMLQGPIPTSPFEAAFACDVFEHIAPDKEAVFLTNAANSLSERGALILGIPSLESQPYASPQSKEGHVNCKSGPAFRAAMQPYFHNVFLFSMNDEVVHTGFYPMAHYLFTLCVGPKR